MSAPTLKELLQKTQDQAIEQSAANVGSIGSNRPPTPIPPRGFASPQDAYETDIGYDSPFMNFAPGARRPMWQLPDIAVTHTPVNTLSSSATPRTTQATQVTGGGAQNGVKATTGWGTVPNLELTLVVNGPVNMSATIPVQSTTASDPVQFAFYRNAQPIGQIFSHTTASTVNTATLVTVTLTDPSPLQHSPLNSEVYSVYWKGASGNVSSPGVGRSFFLTSLIPH
jgi:hypothetical protein